VQPGREGRFAAKGANLAKQLQKGFLHQVFGIGGVPDHTQAQSVDAAAVHLVQKFKSSSISSLCEADGIRFSQRGRLAGRLPGLGWSFLGQQSNNGASKLWDAPCPPLSCLLTSVHW
jgi:hypothetical protein